MLLPARHDPLIVTGWAAKRTCATVHWVAMADLSWRAAIARYRTPRHLVTRARRAPFEVVSVGDALNVTPASGRARPITERQWERSLPHIDRGGRALLQEASFNSSYIEAIVDDVRRG